MRPNFTICGLLLPLFLFLSVSDIHSQNFPTGFSQVKVLSMTQLTAMSFAPDGRLFICQRNGTVRIIKNGQLLATPFLTVNVDQNGERGISGITFDPDFQNNKYVYLYYSAVTPTIHNRLSRFTANGDVVMANSEVALLDAEPVTSVFHNGGGLGFGPDGKLYLSMGEDNKPNNAQNLATYKGKLLRMNKDGTAPTDNPYSSSTSQITKKIWCLGLRNPYTLAFHPGTGKLFINNVGADSYEEIHDGTVANKNFGWPLVEGYSSDPAYTNPVFAYPHESTGQRGCAVTGGAFFNPSSTNYPPQYTGKYFYMDYCNGWIYYLTLGGTVTNSVFATGLTTKNLALQVGPDGNFYYLNRDDVKGGVYKIIYSNNNAPAITAQPVSTSVPQGQPVSFNVSASGAQPLSYQWRKNGVNIPGATAATYSIGSVQTSDAGQYSVRVSNSYGSATSNSASLTVTAFNESPNASILTPTGQPMFRAGDVISFSGDATDKEDGSLPASAFEWEVQFHHNNTHFHPGPAIPAGVKSGTFQTSSDEHTTANVFYRLILRVKDSNNLIDTTHIDIHPITSSVSLNTSPAGMKVTFASQPVQTPYSQLSVEGLKIVIGPVSPQTKDGKSYVFDHWQHGGSATQTIMIGSADSSYLAVYRDTTIADNSLIAAGSQWKYLDNGSNQGSSWRSTTFNDGAWKTGNAELGYGDGDEATTVSFGTTSTNKHITTYFRKQFSVTDAAAVSELELNVKRDDGVVIYLNGTEVMRDNMPTGTISYTTRAVNFIDGTAESTFIIKKFPPTSLRTGTNIIAVEIHQQSGGSSDISFDLILKATTGSTGSGSCTASGTILREYWSNVSSVTLSDINFNAAPTSTSQLNLFEGPSNVADNYASRIRGYICPPVTGSYTFYIASDNSSALYLSTGEDPANKTKIAEVNGYTSPRQYDKYTTQKSMGITLEGGQKYYIEAIHRESSSGDNLSVGWQLPDNTMERPIPGNRLSPYQSGSVTPMPECDATIQPQGSTTFCQGGSVVLKANSGEGLSYQWRKDGVNIPGATSQTYTATGGGEYQVKVTAGDCVDFSAPVIVSVNTSITAKITTSGPANLCNGSATLYANTCSGYYYQWKRNGSDIPGATSATYVAASTGTYQLKIIQGSSVAWSAKLEVKSCTGSETSKIAGQQNTSGGDSTGVVTDLAKLSDTVNVHVNVYPNPSTGLFAFELCLEDVPEDMMEIRVVNLMGNEVYAKPPKRISGCIKENIELSGLLPTGIYVLKLTVGGKTESTRVLLTGK